MLPNTLVALAILGFTGQALAVVTPAPSPSLAVASYDPPANAVVPWYYKSRSFGGPFRCVPFGSSKPGMWAMLNAYRSGGQENVHWKYVSIGDTSSTADCLRDWTYYSKNGTGIYQVVKGRATMERDTEWWCALPVYRLNGKQGYQWDACTPVNTGHY